MQFDSNFVLWINSFAGKNNFVDGIIIFLGEYFIFFVLLGVFITAYMFYCRQKQLTSLFPFISAGLSALLAYFPIAFIIKNVTARPRPFVVLSLHQLIQDNSFAFPSGHTIFLFALGTMIFPYHKKIGIFTIISGFLVGLARVAAGVHYPSDILGGAVIGVVIGVCMYSLHTNVLAKSYARLLAIIK